MSRHSSTPRTLLIVCILLTLTIFAFIGVAELYFRMSAPFNAKTWHWRFDPRFGTNQEPGAVVQHTNGVDFWQRTTANSFGFLDREPPRGEAGDRCRVLFIGDSFVEAAQIPIESKFHVLFEGLARLKLPALQIETLAFGTSGTGQANQLSFYEEFGAPLQPDVVVLVVSGNDFANNSSLLESVRNGWHPSHLPRLFFRRKNEGARRLPIDPDWRQYRLDDPVDGAPALHEILIEHSYLYHWMFRHLQAKRPLLAALIIGQSRADIWTARMRAIQDIDGFEDAFADWHFPDDLNLDAMFYSDGLLPPVFEDALSLTGHALDEFRRYAHEDGFHLVVFAGHGLSPEVKPGTERFGRTMNGRGALARLEELTAVRNIDLVDQTAYLLAQGGTRREARFRRDAHWSEQGHEWAAGAMLDYFLANTEVCSRSE